MALRLLLLSLPPLGSCLTLHRQSLAAYPSAICSDGTPAAYYFRPADSAADSWLLHLQGGGWCWDALSCRQRCGRGSHPVLCSSSDWGESFSLGGLFDSSASEITRAHKVFVRYCTSDAHMGNASKYGLQARSPAAPARGIRAGLLNSRPSPANRLHFPHICSVPRRSSGAGGALGPHAQAQPLTRSEDHLRRSVGWRPRRDGPSGSREQLPLGPRSGGGAARLGHVDRHAA